MSSHAADGEMKISLQYKKHIEGKDQLMFGEERRQGEVWVTERQSWLSSGLWYSSGVGCRVYSFK